VILIDSSCWVDFYRRDGDPGIQEAVAAALESGEAATCGIVRVEILAFIARTAEQQIVAADFSALFELPIDSRAVEHAIAWGQALRRKGETAPATDLLIAAVASVNDAVLLHHDRHFETIAGLGRLRQELAGGRTANP